MYLVMMCFLNNMHLFRSIEFKIQVNVFIANNMDLNEIKHIFLYIPINFLYKNVRLTPTLFGLLSSLL